MKKKKRDKLLKEIYRAICDIRVISGPPGPQGPMGPMGPISLPPQPTIRNWQVTAGSE